MKVAWPHQSQLHYVDDLVSYLSWEDMAPGWTMGRIQTGGGSVILWVMLCWEILVPGIYANGIVPKNPLFSGEYLPFSKHYSHWALRQFMQIHGSLWVTNILKASKPFYFITAWQCTAADPIHFTQVSPRGGIRDPVWPLNQQSGKSAKS